MHRPHVDMPISRSPAPRESLETPVTETKPFEPEQATNHACNNTQRWPEQECICVFVLWRFRKRQASATRLCQHQRQLLGLAQNERRMGLRA